MDEKTNQTFGDKELGEEYREKSPHSKQAGDYPIEDCPHSTWAA